MTQTEIFEEHPLNFQQQNIHLGNPDLDTVVPHIREDRTAKGL